MRIKFFENEEFGKVRTVTIDGESWFVAADVCNIFGETNRNRAMQSLDSSEKGYTQMDTPGGKQRVAIVNEPGLYSLLLAMQPSKARGVSDQYIALRQEKLKGFKRWVTSEVLPALRKGAGLEAIEALKMLSRENQKRGNAALYAAIPDIDRATYCKAASITGKEIANRMGLDKRIPKADVPPEFLPEYDSVFSDVTHLMVLNERYGLGLSVSRAIHQKSNTV